MHLADRSINSSGSSPQHISVHIPHTSHSRPRHHIPFQLVHNRHVLSAPDWTLLLRVKWTFLLVARPSKPIRANSRQSAQIPNANPAPYPIQYHTTSTPPPVRLSCLRRLADRLALLSHPVVAFSLWHTHCGTHWHSLALTCIHQRASITFPLFNSTTD